jgi:PAS domain S-box-containing protein
MHNHPLPCLLINYDDHAIIASNAAATKLFRKSCNELEQTFIYNYATCIDKQKLKQYLDGCKSENSWSDTIYFKVGEEELLIAEAYGYCYLYNSKLVHLLTLIDRTHNHTEYQQLSVIAQRYFDFIEQSSEGIYLHDFATPIPINLSDTEFVQELRRNSYITECNNALAQMYGYNTADEIRGLSASIFVDFDDPQNIEYLKLFKRNGLRILDTESKEVDRYGKQRYFLNNLVSVVEDGLLKRVWGTQRDITERREIEKKVQLLTSLVEHTSDVLIAIDKDFNPLTWNNAAEKIFGLTAKQVIGKTLKRYIDIQYLSSSKEEIVVTIHSKGEWRGEISFRRPTDQQIVTLFAGYKALSDEDGRLIGYLLSATDITQRIKVDKRIQLLASLVKNTSDVLIALDLNYITISWNKAAERLSGIKAEQVIGKDVRVLLDLHHYEHDGRDVLDVLHLEGKWHGEVHFMRPSDGKMITMLSTYKQHKDESGLPIGFIVSCTDITERKEAEWKLQESEQRFRKLIHDLQVGVLLQDSNGRILMANQYMLDYFTLTENELKGKLVFDLVSAAIYENGRTIAFSERLIIKVLQTKQPIRGAVIGVTLPNSSEKKWVMLDLHPIFNDHGEMIHIVTSLIDITERKNLETKLRLEEVRHQRLLTQATIDGQEKERREIGKELHDNIGQQLTTTKLYLDMAESTARAPTDEMIQLAIKSITSVINEIRGISRALVPPTLGDLGLIDSVTDLIESLSRTQTTHIKLICSAFNETSISDNKKLMFFRIIQEQLNNIVKHAKAETASIRLESFLESITLEIKDDGMGFDLDKEKSGIGLTNIRNRAELFGGTVDIISGEGKGCVLKVRVPLASPL